MINLSANHGSIDPRDRLQARGRAISVRHATHRGRGRLRVIAARTGLEPEQVLAQLADRVRMDDDGVLAVDSFTPC